MGFNFNKIMPLILKILNAYLHTKCIFADLTTKITLQFNWIKSTRGTEHLCTKYFTEALIYFCYSLYPVHAVQKMYHCKHKT